MVKLLITNDNHEYLSCNEVESEGFYLKIEHINDGWRAYFLNKEDALALVNFINYELNK